MFKQRVQLPIGVYDGKEYIGRVFVVSNRQLGRLLSPALSELPTVTDVRDDHPESRWLEMRVKPSFAKRGTDGAGGILLILDKLVISDAPSRKNVLVLSSELCFSQKTKPCCGAAVLAFPRSSGLKLGQILGGLDSLPNELDVDLNGILTEVGNIVLNGVLGSMGNIFDTTLQYSLPELLTDCAIDDLVTVYASVNQQIGRTVIVANAHFAVAEREIDGSLVIVFEFGKIESALRTILPAA